MESLTAILYFSRTSAVESSTKKLVQQSVSVNRVLIAKLITHTRQILVQSKLPVFHIDETRQHGDSFGERLDDAIHQVFEMGFEKIIIVGNDCPEISTQLILEADNYLLQHEIVAGPSKSGGLYLLGLSKKSFLKNIIGSIQWNTNQVGKELLRNAQRLHTTYAILPVLEDLNSAHDLKVILERSPKLNLLIKYFESIIASFNTRKLQTDFSFLRNYLFCIKQFRAPPVI